MDTERIIGSIRRECLDHVIIFNERHLRCDGHPGSDDRSAITMAKWTHGEADRLNPGGIALIMSWCLASSTFATCWDRTKDITMTLARIYR